jgi:predicted 3-demethylubiquinone-9 3-methyltransferase (glyoxalase superfamily)
MQRITTFLWFDNNAEEAARFYTSIFKNSAIKSTGLVVTFELEGQEYMALNGGPMFHFTEAVSLYVACETQEEVDYYWEKLSEGGSSLRCGWLKDKFGLSWQVIPNVLSKLVMGGDPARAKRVMDVVMKSVKLIIRELEEA